MSGAKLAGLVVLGLVLFGVVGAANVVTTAERTALNGEYVTDRIESTGSYEGIRDATVDAVVDRIETADLGEGQRLLQADGGTDNRTLVEDAVTEEYIETQASENIRSLYAYLHGEQSALGMEIDLIPLKDNLAESFADQVDSANTSTLIDEFGPEAGRTPVPIDGDLVRQLRSGSDGYEQARLGFRVDVGVSVTGNDEKLLLIGENPAQYSERQKERIVADREQEIRAEIRQEIQDGAGTLSTRVQREVQQRRSDARDRVCGATVGELQPDGGQQVCSSGYQDGSDTTHLDNVTRAAVELQYVIVDGLARAESRYGYTDFDADLTRSEDHLANETADLAESRIEDGVPDTLSAEDQFGADATNALEDAQGAVGIVDTVYLALPIAALLLVALAYAISRSFETTATFAGVVLALTGGLHLAAATVLGGLVTTRVESVVENADVAQFTDVVMALVEGVLGTHTTQSALLLVVGVVLLALSYASTSGKLDGITGTTTGARGGSQPPQQTRQSRQGQRPPQDDGREGSRDRGGDRAGRRGQN